jgi:hypothetical protein
MQSKCLKEMVFKDHDLKYTWKFYNKLFDIAYIDIISNLLLKWIILVCNLGLLYFTWITVIRIKDEMPYSNSNGKTYINIA